MSKYELIVKKQTIFKHEAKPKEQLTEDKKANIPEKSRYIVQLDSNNADPKAYHRVILPKDQKIKDKLNWYVFKEHVELKPCK